LISLTLVYFDNISYVR